jgi:hypothetical protein
MDSPSTRSVKRKVDLVRDVQKYSKIIEEASQNIQRSIVQQLQHQNNQNKSQTRTKVTREHGEVERKGDIIKRGEEEEEIKAEKKDKLK